MRAIPKPIRATLIAVVVAAVTVVLVLSLTGYKYDGKFGRIDWSAMATGTQSATAEGWLGADLHLVDGTWIGTEIECSSGDVGHGEAGVECRTIIARALAELEPGLRDGAKRAVLANLPTTYVSAAGEERMPRLMAGITARRAVVIDEADGSRRVIGLWCYLPYAAAGGHLQVSAVTCSVSALTDWREGNEPPA